LISNKTVLIVGGDVNGWLLNLDTWEVQMTNNGPAVSRNFATTQKVNGKFYVLGGDSALGKAQFRTFKFGFILKIICAIYQILLKNSILNTDALSL